MEERVTDGERAAFSEALHRVMCLEQSRAQIGQLSEKKLHLTLKYFYQPDDAFHEQKIGQYFADAVTENGIVEIQTSHYGNLREKLRLFSPLVPVTVVCPYPYRKTVTWVDPGSGELSAAHKSPKTGSVADVFWEFAHIRDCLLLPGVTFRVLLIDMKEYRYRDGWGKDGKRGSTRCELVPVSLERAFSFRSPADYAAVLPSDLPSPFTAAACAKAMKLPVGRVREILYVLLGVGAVRRTGKQGRAFLYELLT